MAMRQFRHGFNAGGRNLKDVKKAEEVVFNVGDVVTFRNRMNSPFYFRHGNRFPEELYVVAGIDEGNPRRGASIVIVPAVSRELQEADKSNPEVHFRMMRYAHITSRRVPKDFNMLVKVPGYVLDDEEPERKNFPEFKCVKEVKEKVEVPEEEKIEKPEEKMEKETPVEEIEKIDEENQEK